MSISTIDRRRPMTFLLLLLAAFILQGASGRAALAAESGTDFSEVCRMSSGYTWHDVDGSLSCCWDGWGCVVCSRDAGGYIIEGSCRVKCSSSACADANALTTGDPVLPDTVKNPEQFFGAAPDAVAPTKNPQTKKPIKADPAPATVQ